MCRLLAGGVFPRRKCEKIVRWWENCVMEAREKIKMKKNTMKATIKCGKYKIWIRIWKNVQIIMTMMKYFGMRHTKESKFVFDVISTHTHTQRSFLLFCFQWFSHSATANVERTLSEWHFGMPHIWFIHRQPPAAHAFACKFSIIGNMWKCHPNMQTYRHIGIFTLINYHHHQKKTLKYFYFLITFVWVW